MKKLLLGLLVLSSFSVSANGETLNLLCETSSGSKETINIRTNPFAFVITKNDVKKDISLFLEVPQFEGYSFSIRTKKISIGGQETIKARKLMRLDLHTMQGEFLEYDPGILHLKYSGYDLTCEDLGNIKEDVSKEVKITSFNDLLNISFER